MSVGIGGQNMIILFWEVVATGVAALVATKSGAEDVGPNNYKDTKP